MGHLLVRVERPEHLALLYRVGLLQRVLHEARHREGLDRSASLVQEIDHSDRRGDQPRAILPFGAAAKRGDHDDARNAKAADRFGRGAGEVDVRVVERFRRGGRRYPEHGLRAVEGAIDHRGIAVRSLDDIDSIADRLRQLARIAHDAAHRFVAVEQMLDDVVADIAGRRRDDDHVSAPL